MDFSKARRRYLNDATFHRMVDVMVNAIDELMMSPGEIREAAVFAEIVHAERRQTFALRAKDPQP